MISDAGLVLDASVAVKLFVTEPGSAEAAKHLESASLIAAPALLRLETLTAVIIRMRAMGLVGRLIEKQVDLLLGLMAGPRFALTPNDALMDEALALALGTPCRLPDCLYVVLARELNLPLVTADRKQADLARNLGIPVSDAAWAGEV